MTTEGDASRIEDLEARIGVLEDLLAIYRLMASYGPAVDSNALEEAVNLWTESGEYDMKQGQRRGRAALKAGLEGPLHQDIVRAGCAHQVSAPRLSLDEDRAVATGYQQVVVHRAGGGGEYGIRQLAMRAELVRTADGWRSSHRIVRYLDGDLEARHVLRHDPPPTS